MDFYVKDKKRYKKIKNDGFFDPAVGRPMDGMWLVQDKGTGCTWLGSVSPGNRIDFIIKSALTRHQMEIADYMIEIRNSEKPISAMDITHSILNIVCRRKDADK